MLPLLTIILGLFLCLLSHTANATFYGSSICSDNDRYECYQVKRHDTWETLFPDADRRDLVMRVNRMNVPLEHRMLIAVPKNRNKSNRFDFSPFSKQITPPGEKLIIVSLNRLAFGAYDEQGN